MVLLVVIFVIVAIAALIMAVRSDRAYKRAKGVDWKGDVFPPPDEP